MKKNQLICLLLCLALSVQLFIIPVSATEVTESTPETTEDPQVQLPVTVTEPVPLSTFAGQDASIAGGSRTIEAKSSLQGNQQILQTAQAAMLYEINSDSVVYSWNPDLVVEPYGLAKIMTALLVLEKVEDWEEIVTIQSAWFDSIDYVSNADFIYMDHTLDLRDGEEVRVKDLLYGIIIWNANDAALALANYVSGSVSAFVDEMNKRAKELGCTNTNFTNPHGLEDENMYTTARDMVRIVMEASKHEEYLNMASTGMYYMEETNMAPARYYMYNDNYMIDMFIFEIYYNYLVSGGKAGESSFTGLRNFTCTAELDDLSYVCVIMNAKPDRDESGEIKYEGYQDQIEAEQLLDIGFEGYELKQVIQEGQITSHFKVNNGSNDVVAAPDRSVKTLLPSNIDLDDLTLRYEKTNGVLDAPVEKGTVIDTMTVWYGGVCVAQADLVTMNSAKVSTAASGEGMDQGDGIGLGLTIFLVILALIIGAAAALYIMRYINIRRARSRRRRRSRARRRSY